MSFAKDLFGYFVYFGYFVFIHSKVTVPYFVLSLVALANSTSITLNSSESGDPSLFF